MALTKTQVSQLYVAIFNRASEGEGNTYWQTAVEGMAATATEMLATDAAKTYFGTSLDTDQAFIEHIYKNTLGKTYAEDKAGIDYWVSLLADGMSKGEVVAALIVAAQDPANAGAAQDMFNNKVEVSDYTATKIEKAEVTELKIFQDLISGVTADGKTVNKSKEAVDAEANKEITGETKFLKVEQDFLTGTENNDVFVSYVAQNQFGQQVNTLGSGDVINGGAGTDTLDAQITAGAWAGNTNNGNMAISPITKSVENIILHADIADISANDTVIVDAKNMDGVLKIASNYSDASLVIKNMIGPKKGVYGGTAEQTVAMEYTGNKDSAWEESDMTVYYDQDYLTRSAEKSGAELEIRLANLYENKKDNSPIVSFDSITITLLGKGTVVVDIKEAQGLKGDAAYNKIVQLMNAKFKAEGWDNVSAKTLAARDLIFSDDVNNGEYIKGTSAGTYLPILVTNTGEEEFDLASFVSNNNSKHGNRLETSLIDPTKQADTPVSINVDLEKVGLAADGGALTIGSMNKSTATAYDNVYGYGQGKTTTETVAGFDEFNVHVAGDKTKNSSLSSLHSTNNTLRKVTIDSKTGSDANLTIGNSNTLAVLTDEFNSSANNAKAFKDVQIMNASTFAGNLTLNAGFTEEIVAKYLANAEETTLYGLNSAKNELASFDYKGGEGDDTLNLALDLEDFAEENFTHATNTNGLNVFKMNIDGGAGNDTIIVDADTAGTAALTATNITINGGAGNDIIDISSNDTAWSYNIAFNGAHFGHDVVKGFNTGVVAITDEAQNIDLSGFVAHKGETIVVTVGDKFYNFAATGDMNDAAIAAQVATMLLPGATATPIQQFTTAAATGAVVGMGKTDANVNSVTVEIKKHNEGTGTFDKDLEAIHTATSNTTKQGGLLEGTAGADTLDFSAYNVKGVVINNGTTDVVAKGSVITTAGDKFIYLEASAHNATNGYTAYNVYEATAKSAITTDADVSATGNATKAAVIGSIQLEDATGVIINLTTLDASQLLF